MTALSRLGPITASDDALGYSDVSYPGSVDDERITIEPAKMRGAMSANTFPV